MSRSRTSARLKPATHSSMYHNNNRGFHVASTEETDDVGKGSWRSWPKCHEMPIIFAQLGPFDLFHLSRATKDLRNMFISLNAIFCCCGKWYTFTHSISLLKEHHQNQNLWRPPPICPPDVFAYSSPNGPCPGMIFSFCPRERYLAGLGRKIITGLWLMFHDENT